MFDRDTVLNDLRTNVLEVTFKKVDGSTRVMRCTLMPEHLPKNFNENVEEQNNEKSFHSQNPNVIAAWDVQKGGWRSFRMDSVEYLQVIDGY